MISQGLIALVITKYSFLHFNYRSVYFHHLLLSPFFGINLLFVCIVTAAITPSSVKISAVATIKLPPSLIARPLPIRYLPVAGLRKLAFS